MKRVLAPLLAAALVLGCVVLPASASFPDVDDPALSQATEVLRLLGVVNGAPDGKYYPQGTFTRAEFCKMALTVLGRQGEAAAAAGRVIFSDVTAAHWALGYVNAAAAVTEGAEPLVRGRGAGLFEPDAPITWGEAVTILLRALGYGEGDLRGAGAWYAGAMARGASTGLLEGLEAAGDETITRGEAALLFENLLFVSPKGSGQTFLASSLGGEVTGSQLLLDLEGKALAAGGHTLRTDGGTYRTYRTDLDPALMGTRARLVLDGDGDVLALLPDEETATRRVRLTAAESRFLTAGGERVTVSADLPVYREGEVLGTYGELYATRAFSAGVTALLCLDKTDSVYAIFLLDQVVEVGTPALTGVYQAASPSPAAPQVITLLDHPFPVLDSALDSLSHYRPGDVITLVLDGDNAVTAVLDPETATVAALGVASFREGTDEEGKTVYTATVDLALGFSVSGRVPAPSRNALRQAPGRVAAVSSSQVGELTLTYPESHQVPGGWSISLGTLGTLPVSNSVAVYDRVAEGPLVKVDMDQLTVSAVAAEDITYLHLNDSGVVDLVVLDDVTGEGYTYGFISKVGYTSDWVGGMEVTNPAVFLHTAGEELPFIEGQLDFSDELGAFYGMAPALEHIGEAPRLAATVALKRVPGVRRTAFEKGTVTVEGKVYPLAREVLCWNVSAAEPFQSLEEALAYSVYLTVYFDRPPEEGGKVRVVTAG